MRAIGATDAITHAGVGPERDAEDDTQGRQVGTMSEKEEPPRNGLGRAACAAEARSAPRLPGGVGDGSS